MNLLTIVLSGLSVTLFFVSFVLCRKNLQINARKNSIKSENTRLELKALNAQIKPHFIFNCLNSINNYIIKSKTQEASSFLAAFSKLIRMTLEYSDEQKITLSQELEHLELYMRMEQLRLNNMFEYDIIVDAKLHASDILVPPLILQTFVENSIWHGIYPKNTGGRISINISQINRQAIQYIVEDDGQGRMEHKETDKKLQKSFGMKATDQRIKLLSQDATVDGAVRVIDLKTDNNASCGTKVIVTLPLQLN